MKSLEDIIREICLEDPRFKPQAYYFIYEALDYTQKKLKCSGHVTGPQLAEGIRQLALERFGLMARRVFREWGVNVTSDFGAIVFALVSKNAMGKTDDDNAHDFEDLYKFDEVFSESEAMKKEWRIKEE